MEYLTDVAGLILLACHAVAGLATLPFARRSGRRDAALPACLQNAESLRVLLDSEFRFAEVPEEFCELVGFSQSELIGKPIHSVTPEDFICASTVAAEVRARGRKQGFWLYRRRNRGLILAHYDMRRDQENMTRLLITPTSSKRESAQKLVRESLASGKGDALSERHLGASYSSR